MNTRTWVTRLLVQYGPGWVLAGYLVYQLVNVFLPSLISETRNHSASMAAQTLILTHHVTATETMESSMALLVNLATQDCVNQARANSQPTTSCFAVARGESPR